MRLLAFILLFQGQASAEIYSFQNIQINFQKLLSELRASGIYLVKQTEDEIVDGWALCENCRADKNGKYAIGKLQVHLEDNSSEKINLLNTVVAAHVP